MKEKFDFEKIEDFERHISLSIPNYEGLYELFSSIALEYMHPSGTCIDIGCSTGRFLNDLSSHTDGLYIGVDLVDMPSEKNFCFVKRDLISALKDIEKCDLIISMFTLQFLGKHKRKEAISEIKRLVDGGAKLLISEKVFLNDSKLSAIVNKEYYNQKRKFFTDKEILDKDYSLIGKMFCVQDFEIKQELEELGCYEQVWQSYNFKGWFVEKL